MASVTCVFCSAENEQGEQLCRACFRRLPAEPVAAPPHVATEPGVPSEPSQTPARCPHCGEEIPDPGNRVCVECHRPLTRTEPMRLNFPGGGVTVDRAQTVKLGRDPATSPAAGLFTDRGNISRLHATVGVDDEGAWVRDEKSLNGTYVNDVPVPPGTRFGLRDGDTLRLAADVVAKVQVSDSESAG